MARFVLEFSLLLSSHHLGTAYTLMKSFDASFAPVSSSMMERMLDSAVSAKDRFRVGERVGVERRRKAST